MENENHTSNILLIFTAVSALILIITIAVMVFSSYSIYYAGSEATGNLTVHIIPKVLK